MPADAAKASQLITASPDELAALKAAGVAPRPIAPAEDQGPGQAAESAPAADLVAPVTDRGNQAQQSGTSPPPDPKRAAIQPLVDRVRTIDCWFVAKGESPKHRASTPIADPLLANHLNGTGVSVGACPMERGSSTTRLALLDLDDHDKVMKWADVMDIARDLAAAAQERGVELVPFRSSGGRGMHLYAIWDQPQDARSVRISLDGVLTDCGYASGAKGLQMNEVEVFPKQSSVPTDGWGNMFVLPGSRESAPVDLATGELIGWDQVGVASENGK